MAPAPALGQLRLTRQSPAPELMHLVGSRPQDWRRVFRPWREKAAAGSKLFESRDVVGGHASGREARLKAIPDSVTVYAAYLLDCLDGLVQGRHDQARHAVIDYLGHGSLAPGNDRSSGRHRLDHHQPKRLGPIDREQ